MKSGAAEPVQSLRSLLLLGARAADERLGDGARVGRGVGDEWFADERRRHVVRRANNSLGDGALTLVRDNTDGEGQRPAETPRRAAESTRTSP